MATVSLIEKGSSLRIELDPYEILHDVLNGEQRQMLIESLSCHDEVINNVAEQLINGYTYNGFSGSWCGSRTGALQLARQKIAENSDYAVKKTIEDLERQVRNLEAQIEHYRKNYVPATYRE